MYYITTEQKNAFVVGILIGVAIAATVWGFVVRYIMKGKGYQNLGTLFCCGFFLGIIGLVIAITRPDLKNQPFQNGNPYANPYGQPMQPPYPNQPYQYGQPMQPPYPPNAPYGMPGQPMPNQQGVRCQTCGMMNPPGAVFCSGCGNKMV